MVKYVMSKSLHEGIVCAAEDLAVEIAPAYKVLNWRWYNNRTKQPDSIPSKSEIKEELVRLAEELFADQDLHILSVYSGGLKVSRYKDEDSSNVFALEFVRGTYLSEGSY